MRSLGWYDEALRVQQENLAEFDRAGVRSGYVHEELAECLWRLGRQHEARQQFAEAHALLVADPWLRRDEPDRLARLADLGGVPTDPSIEPDA